MHVDIIHFSTGGSPIKSVNITMLTADSSVCIIFIIDIWEGVGDQQGSIIFYSTIGLVILLPDVD